MKERRAAASSKDGPANAEEVEFDEAAEALARGVSSDGKLFEASARGGGASFGGDGGAAASAAGFFFVVLLLLLPLFGFSFRSFCSAAALAASAPFHSVSRESASSSSRYTDSLVSLTAICATCHEKALFFF